MLPIAIEGHKGAGKTPLISSIKKSLEKRKYRYKVLEPWQMAIRHFMIDPYHLFANPDTAVEISSFLTQQVESALKNTPKDTLLIYDRHWLTFYMSLTVAESMDSDDIEVLSSHLDVWLGQSPWTYFIASTPDILYNRKSRKGPPPWDENRDYRRRLEFYELFKDRFAGIYWVLRPRIDMDVLADNILNSYFEENGEPSRRL